MMEMLANEYGGNHFAIYVFQINMLYTLNLHSVICQLYLNATGRRKKVCGKVSQLLPIRSLRVRSPALVRAEDLQLQLLQLQEP